MRALLASSLLFGVALLAPTSSRSQLVADGSTNILDGVVSNFVSDITVGTNGSFTLLVLTNGAVVTGGSNTFVGASSSAKTNSVVLSGLGCKWTNSLDFTVGQTGSFNQFSILSGAVVSNRSGTIGQNSASSNNLVVVSGPGSLWANWTTLSVGGSGRANQLVVSNGGVVANGSSCWIGQNASASVSNTVTVTGTNSLWKCFGLTVSQNGFAAHNRLLLADSGTVSNSSDCIIGYSSWSNTFLATDPGSRFANSGYIQLGLNGRGNQLIVSNGAVVASDYTYVGTNSFGYQNTLTLTGAGSLLTNRHDFYLGNSGYSNQLYLSDGATLADNFGYIGSSNVDNRALISGANTLWTNRSDLYLGSGAFALHNQLTVSNGARVFDNNGYIGFNSGGTNVAVVTGTGSLWTNRTALVIGQASQLFVTNGGTVASPFSSVAVNQSGITNRVVVAGPGSVWRTLGNLNIGTGSLYASGNEFMITNGGSVFASNLTMNVQPITILVASGGSLFVTNALTESYFCTVTLDGGLINATSFAQGGGTRLVLNFKGGTLQTRFTSDIAAFPPTPFVIGDGTAQATFELLSSGTHTFANGLVISSNALIKGVGAIVGNVSVLPGGTLSPGSSIGQMSIKGLVLNDGSTNVMEVNASSGACDTIVGLTNISYGGTLQLVNLAGTLTNGSSFQLYSASNYNGAFSAIMPSFPGPDLKWNTNRLTVDGLLRVVGLHASAPTIASAQVSGANLVLQAAGGVPYDPCYVLTCTNLAPPVDWHYVNTNTFDANGSTQIALPVSLSQPAQFYRLQVE
jgi:T5SS/PEP-CTERM-associated repeat protein